MNRWKASAIAAALAIIVASACDGRIHLPATSSATADAAPPSGDATADRGGPLRCARDSDCASAMLHCDLASGTCFQCTSDAHCLADDLKRCDVALRRCVECGVPADCSSGMTCEPSSKKCVVACSATTSCPAEAPTCDVVRGVCVACTVQASCIDASKPYCENASGRCVECTMDAHCRDEPRCDTVTGRCVECLSSSDCPAEEPICDPQEWSCRN